MPVLRINDRGALVQILQLGLIRSGYLSGSPDGIFGPDTQSALRLFQRNFGLPQTGELDAATWAQLQRFIKGYFTKTVARGDTFWGLAAQYGTSVVAIRAANPGADPNRLQIGQRITVPFGFPVVPGNIAYSYELVALLLDGLKARYPFIGTQVIGQSVMDRDLTAIRIGTGENTLFVNASFHANEWINTPVTLTFAENYLSAYVRGGTIGGADARALFERVTLILVPLVNPDGVDLVTGAITSGFFYGNAVAIAENYPAIPFPSGWKANIEGVDLNLQFPANWERAREIKFAQGFTSPAPRDFVGEAPLTAPEAAAIADFTDRNDFDMIIAYHTQGNIIYWKYLDYLPPESRRIGESLSRASGYTLELTPAASAYAGYKDWFIQENNRPGYTVETGRGSNPLPIAQFSTIYAANEPLLVTALQETAAL
ncbi:MAG: peptidoglycan-binding protein [Clostridia bacterium]|nr:peptidoglycan-binding protein [Clostridia bacterium]